MATQRETMALNGVPGSVLGDEERSDEAPSTGAQTPRVVPDPEVVAKPTRRQFSAAYRLRIIEEADRCTEPGELGRLLRREGLYSSHLSSWRKARREGSLAGLASKKRGAKPKARNPLAGQVRELEAKVARLEKDLEKAHTILEVQGNVPRPARPSWSKRNSGAGLDYDGARGERPSTYWWITPQGNVVQGQ